MVYKLYLLKISNFIHEIQMNERIILIDLCENDLMNKCRLFYKLSAFEIVGYCYFAEPLNWFRSAKYL